MFSSTGYFTMPYITNKPVSLACIALFVFFCTLISSRGRVTPISLSFLKITSRPSGPGIVKLLPPDWEPIFSFFFDHNFLGF